LAAHPIYKRLQTLHDLLGMERSMEEIIFRVGEQLSGVALANGEPV